MSIRSPQGSRYHTVDTLLAGRYAIYTHRGSYDGVPEASRRLFELWLPQSGEEIDDRACM